jgi:hypothetical protein
VTALDRGQIVSVGDDEIVGTGHHHAAERSEGLGVPDDALALHGIVEQLREPCDGGDELDAHADERAAAPEEEPVDRRCESGCERSERVDQDAPDQHAAASKEVGEVSTDQSEDAACDGGHVLHRPDPRIDGKAIGFGAEEFRERWPHDERQHQQFVGVEGEAQGGDSADGPLQWRQRLRRRARLGLRHATSIRRRPRGHCQDYFRGS